MKTDWEGGGERTKFARIFLHFPEYDRFTWQISCNKLLILGQAAPCPHPPSPTGLHGLNWVLNVLT